VSPPADVTKLTWHSGILTGSFSSSPEAVTVLSSIARSAALKPSCSYMGQSSAAVQFIAVQVANRLSPRGMVTVSIVELFLTTTA
jgi:hypothetical protein